MKLTVMMAAWNAETYISYALRSILTQQMDHELEIIVVNDGSTDRTVQILDEMARKHTQIRVHHTANQGVTRARNEALRLVCPTTDLVSFLDSDDLAPQGRYNRDITLFENNPNLHLTFGNTILFREPNADQTRPKLDSATATVRCVQLAAGTYRYDLIRKVGEFDTSFQQAEDMDFMLRMLELSPQYLVIEEPSVYYRRHDRNMTRNTAQLRRDFARALMMSIRRRKLSGPMAYPAELFDAQEMAEALKW